MVTYCLGVVVCLFRSPLHFVRIRLFRLFLLLLWSDSGDDGDGDDNVFGTKQITNQWRASVQLNKHESVAQIIHITLR